MAYDPDSPENQYPLNGSLEEKAAFSLEQQRKNFYWSKRVYETQKEGGPKYTAILMAYGPRAAAQMAATSEEQFAAFCANCCLTKDGETTDPKYPIDKMIGAELYRIRAAIVLSVSNYMYYFESMMPEDLRDWNWDKIYFNLEAYKYRYADTLYEDINVVIPKKKMAPRSVADLESQLDEIATKYSDKNILMGATRSFVIGRIRDTIIEFLLVDLPFNNRSLENKTMLEEVKAMSSDDKKGDKPILH